MWFELARGNRSVAKALRSRLFARRRIMLLMPFLEIFLSQFLGKALGVIARRVVLASLRKIVDRVARHLEDSLRTHKTITLMGFRAEVQPYVHRMRAIVEQRGVNIRHVAPFFPAQNASRCQSALWRFVQAEHEEHAADQVNHQVTRDAGTVLLPAA